MLRMNCAVSNSNIRTPAADKAARSALRAEASPALNAFVTPVADAANVAPNAKANGVRPRSGMFEPIISRVSA